MQIRQKDFLETKEGLIFAVVTDQLEQGKVLSFLRYISCQDQTKEIVWKKLSTIEANSFLAANFPNYLFHSEKLDADLHAVPVEEILTHHRASEKTLSLQNKDSFTPLQNKLIRLLDLFKDNDFDINQLGVTGSFLIGTENSRSDIDLVIYKRDTFQQMRKLIQSLINDGQLSELNDEFWQASYERRACSLSLNDYVWHEKRKFNKAVFDNIKFDISLVLESNDQADVRFLKRGKVSFTAVLVNDTQVFDSPSVYQLDHPEFHTVLCFTPTYSGQAFKNEMVEVSGFLEESSDGMISRVIVGSSREADGEYIKLVREQ